jgi:sterol desaturase/sphingolipid hydroxylase (fatty acid hydroxylase superfamily)
LQTLTLQADGIGTAALVGALLVAGLLEWQFPRRTLQAPLVRWASNIGLALAGMLLFYLVWRPISTAAWDFGDLFPWPPLAMAWLPAWLVIILSVLIVDVLQYAGHRLFHVVPWLWRLHKIHHSDTGFDGTTALRHHPIEILINSSLQVVCFAALGLPVTVIILYGLAIRPLNVFNHANITVPARLDRLLRLALITPDMHRVHHTTRLDEGKCNFGMMFAWWDRLFSSYRAEPAGGQVGCRLGLSELETLPPLGFGALLLLPLRATRASPEPAEASSPELGC